MTTDNSAWTPAIVPLRRDLPALDSEPLDLTISSRTVFTIGLSDGSQWLVGGNQTIFWLVGHTVRLEERAGDAAVLRNLSLNKAAAAVLEKRKPQ